MRIPTTPAFYKKTTNPNEFWSVSTSKVVSKGYILSIDNHFEHEYPMDGWEYHETPPEGFISWHKVNFSEETSEAAVKATEASLSFEEWEKRQDAISSCRELVNTSPIEIPDGKGGVIPLRDMIKKWYSNHLTEVSEFLKYGSNSFLKSIESSEDFWWDLKGSTGTVREQAIGLIKPLSNEAE